MLFVNKLPQIPLDFAEIVGRHTSYLSLSESGADRDTVKLILLNEQGCLCAYCERQLDISTTTIEHFQPKSTFPHLQLDYYNLFACCHVCNGKKTDHLVPAYIFDVRASALDVNHLILNRHRDFQFYYQPSGSHGCILQNNSLSKSVPRNPPQFHADSIFQNTIDLLELNDPKRLSEPRRQVYITVLRQMENLSAQALLAIFNQYRATTITPSEVPGKVYHRHETYLSMILYLLAKGLQKKGIDLAAI